jgi:hypothetical protein
MVMKVVFQKEENRLELAEQPVGLVEISSSSSFPFVHP